MARPRRTGVILVSALIALVCAVAADQWASAQQRFDVEVVRMNKTGEMRYIIDPPRPGRFRAVNAPLRLLIGYAYEIPHYRLRGAPNWIGEQRFLRTQASIASCQNEFINRQLLRLTVRS
jgi:uncharacterized protein (TIGR03435 family)